MRKRIYNEAGTHRTRHDDVSFFANIVSPRGPHHPHLPYSPISWCSDLALLPNAGPRFILSVRLVQTDLFLALELKAPKTSFCSAQCHIHQQCFFFSEAYGSWADCNMINMGSLQVAQVAPASKTVLCHDCHFGFLQGTSPCHCEVGAHGTLPSNTRVTTVPRSTASTKSLGSRQLPGPTGPILRCHGSTATAMKAMNQMKCAILFKMLIVFSSGKFWNDDE